MNAAVPLAPQNGTIVPAPAGCNPRNVVKLYTCVLLRIIQQSACVLCLATSARVKLGNCAAMETQHAKIRNRVLASLICNSLLIVIVPVATSFGRRRVEVVTSGVLSLVHQPSHWRAGFAINGARGADGQMTVEAKRRCPILEEGLFFHPVSRRRPESAVAGQPSRRRMRKDCIVSSPLMLPFVGVTCGACETEGDEGCVTQAIDCPVWNTRTLLNQFLRSG